MDEDEDEEDEEEDEEDDEAEDEEGDEEEEEDAADELLARAARHSWRALIGSMSESQTASLASSVESHERWPCLGSIADAPRYELKRPGSGGTLIAANRAIRRVRTIAANFLLHGDSVSSLAMTASRWLRIVATAGAIEDNVGYSDPLAHAENVSSSDNIST